MARLMQHLTPGRESRRVLIALLAYLALLMPALLPYGAQPADTLRVGLAPHVHAVGVDPHAPHDHGGGTGERAPADVPFVLAHVALAALLPELPQLPTAVAAKAPFVATAAPVHRGAYEPGLPRGPPAQA